MMEHMAALMQLMDTSSQGQMDELCRRFPAFYYSAKILERWRPASAPAK